VNSDGKHLFVAEASNRRVLIWNEIPQSNNEPADIVLGQPDFNTANAASTTQSTFSRPLDVFSDGRHLFVADDGNHRILIWNTIPKANNAPADVVLGQSNFTAGALAAASSRTFEFPWAVFSDGKKLYIADRGNHRVLIWNTIPQTNNAPADIVLGQSNFTNDTSGTANNQFMEPHGIYSDGEKLFVADTLNHRVKIWNQIPTENNISPNVTLTQILRPRSVYYDQQADKLLVVDDTGHRILIWNSLPTLNVSADSVFGQPNLQSISSGTSENKFNQPLALSSDGKNFYTADFLNHRILIFDRSTSVTELGPQFEQGKAVLGKVFEDKNENGRQDKGEKGIEGVKIASDTGIYAITDEDGKYHFPFVQVGQRVLKIDESTLPDGAQITTESPRKVVVTKGILTKVSFGIRLSHGVPESGSDGVTPKPRNPDTPLLKVSMSQDPAALGSRLGVSARQEDVKVIFTIDCNYFLFIERAKLNLYDSNRKQYKTIELSKPLAYEYEMRAEEFISGKQAGPQTFYYQLSVFDNQNHEDRTGLGELLIDPRL
jgi:hypothetical protein